MALYLSIGLYHPVKIDVCRCLLSGTQFCISVDGGMERARPVEYAGDGSDR